MIKASCLLLTYNKPPRSLHLVEEAIESFIRQDYPSKELVILNDAPTQVLRLAHKHENIRLVNLPYRVRTLGEKVNVAAALTTGDLLFRWDDDDIHLPWRISLSVERINNADYWKSSHGWWNPGPNELILNPGYMGACCIKRAAFDKIRGYPHSGVGEDQDIEHVLQQSGLELKCGKLTPEEVFYLYRWGTGSVHVSGYGAEGYARCGENAVRPGEYVMRPNWKRDYVEWSRQVLAKL